MSNRLIDLAYLCDVKRSPKAVLVSLADHANEKRGDRCNPSIARIARRTSLKARTVQLAINDLELLGHVTRYYRSGKSTEYHVHPRISCTPANGAGVQTATATPASERANPCKICGETQETQKNNLANDVRSPRMKRPRSILWPDAKPVASVTDDVLQRISRRLDFDSFGSDPANPRKR